MANELRHSSTATAAGGAMAETDWEDVDIHQFNSQATGDIMYASSATQLSRLAKGAANTVLVMGASIPVWSATLAGLTLTSPTINGTIATTGLTLPAITLGGDMVVTGYGFNAGAGSTQLYTSGSNEGLRIIGSSTASGGSLYIEHTDTTPTQWASSGLIGFRGYDGNGTPAAMRWGYIAAVYANIGDGTEEVRYDFYGVTGGVADNQAMTLTGAGGLSVDADIGTADDPVALFDDYDDALVLRQGIQQNNRELLADIGVLDRKDTGSGYMMKMQPMIRLLAGGIYQTRQMLEDTKEELYQRLDNIERKLLEAR